MIFRGVGVDLSSMECCADGAVLAPALAGSAFTLKLIGHWRGGAACMSLERSFREYLARFSEKTDIRRGVALPLGTYEIDGGINFAVFSRHATAVRLELFTDPADAIATSSILLDPERNRTGDIWHVWIGGIGSGQLYSYRV